MPLDLRKSKELFHKDTQKNVSKKNSIENYYSKEEIENTKDNEKSQNETQGNIGDVLHDWRAPEYEVYEKSGRWYMLGGIFILAMVSYALITNSPIMAITFILLGIVGFIHLEKDPRVITFAITTKGVLADKELYLYENMESFWIFYDPPHTKILSLHTKASFLPFVHIPIDEEHPVDIREKLIEFIEEKKQDPSLIDTIEKVFHI